jgi:hypothetical protein
MVARCAGLGSYRLAQDNLAELCQIYLSPTPIGNIAGSTADDIAARLENPPEVRRNVQEAKGETEFDADGTFVPIRNDDGTAEWREFNLGAFAKRLRGLFAFPFEWHPRTLPNPTVVAAFAAIVDKEEFQELCQTMRRSLGVGGVTSAWGEGAKGIGNVSRAVYGNTDECWDIDHGAEHISDCGKKVFGKSSSKDWLERMRLGV